jgi:hypothetical protein
MKKLILLTLCLGLFSVQGARAQNAAEPAVKLTFKTVGLGVTQSDIFIRQNNSYVPLVIEADAISLQPANYTGSATMELLRKVKNATGITYVPAGQVVFPAATGKETGSFLVLMTAITGGNLTGTPVPDDGVTFPANNLRVINLLPAPAGVMVNKDTNLLKPGESRLFSTTAALNDRAEVHIAVQHRGKWVEVNNNVYPCEKGARLTVFIINRTPPGAPATQLPSIGFHSYVDRPVAVEQEVSLVSNGTGH